MAHLNLKRLLHSEADLPGAGCVCQARWSDLSHQEDQELLRW